MPDSQKYEIPSTPISFRLSRASLGFIFATVILAVLTGFSTYKNIRRGQNLMEQFLLQKGETVIRSIEAGHRTSMMHHMSEGNPLHTLISENIRDDDIAFIRIVNENNRVIDETASPTVSDLSAQQIDRIIRTGMPVTELHNELRIFTVSNLFQPKNHGQGTMMAGSYRMPSAGTPDDPAQQIISIGLITDEFDTARKQDMQHALFMGGILFLIGSVGIYFLFLYQAIRVAKSTLTDMKLYTDNVIESIPAGLITLDAQNRVVSCNRKAEEIFRRTKEEIQGKTITETLPGCSFNCRDICNTAVDLSDEFITDDGRHIPIKISGSCLINPEGRSIGTVLILRDMSSIREMEQQLERSRRMVALGKMAAGIAHEIRNPLGTLRGFAHYFGSRPEANEESKSYANLMISEVDRLNRNVSGLLQFARPREPQFLPVDLDELLAKTAALMESDFANHGLNFYWQRNTGITVFADPDLLLQVLMNLIKNSIHATPPGGQISLTGSESEQNIRITVSDTGSGMNEHEREKMFDPFFTTGKTGTGLGLAVSHQIIEQHQGVFEVETASGKGTTVTLVLPKRKRNDDGEKKTGNDSAGR